MTSALSTEEGPFDQQPASILARILALVLAVFCVLALGFYYMGARYYEPTSGRFISPDPLGHASSMGLYDYANGDPVNGLDPDGRCSSVSNYGGGYSSSYGTKTWSDQLNEAAYVGMHPGKTADISSIPLTYKQDPIDWGQVVDQVANLITRAPVISTIRAATELITGRDLISGQHIYAGDAFQNLMISAALDATLLMPEVRGVAAMGEVGVTRTASNVMRSPLRMAPTVANRASTYERLALEATQNANSSAVVLGKFSQTGVSYESVAKNISATYFQLPAKQWSTLETQLGKDNMWNINKTFLDQQWSAGKDFYFSHNPWNASVLGGSGNYFEREVLHLIDLGAKDFVPAGNGLWKAVR